MQVQQQHLLKRITSCLSQLVTTDEHCSRLLLLLLFYCRCLVRALRLLVMALSVRSWSRCSRACP
jgi:hypothetical protein